jgi:hypothetical protein
VTTSREVRHFRSCCRWGRRPRMTRETELVIIVDDDFRVREALTELLASRNLESIAFQSAVEYLRFGNPDVPS